MSRTSSWRARTRSWNRSTTASRSPIAVSCHCRWARRAVANAAATWSGVAIGRSAMGACVYGARVVTRAASGPAVARRIRPSTISGESEAGSGLVGSVRLSADIEVLLMSVRAVVAHSESPKRRRCELMNLGVVVDGHCRCGGAGLAGEHVAVLDNSGRQREVLFHRHRAEKHLRFACAAGSAETGVRRVQSCFEGGLEDGVTGSQCDVVLSTPESYFHGRWSEAVESDGLLVAVEELQVDVLGVGSTLKDQVAQVGHHLGQTTHEPLVGGGREPGLELDP